jgi:hypothetical protein
MKAIIITAIFVMYIATQNPNDPMETGNCVSGLINFNPARIIDNPFNAQNIDPKLYDFSIDYSPINVLVSIYYLILKLNGEGVQLSLIKTGQTTSLGVRLSSIRYMLYGRFSIRMKGPVVPGVVTTFITLSKRRDEIDW